MTTKAIEVARYLIHLAHAEDEPDFLTHMRLQKLLYYVQGWSLGLTGQPLFEGRIEAWAHGPVVKEVYPKFASFGDTPIDPETVDPAELGTTEMEFVDSVWAEYKKYSASSLRAMTHEESPWVDARGSCGPADKCDSEITHAAMQAFFSKRTGD